jgi:hypothetical protein
MKDPIEPLLARLPEPSPPPALTATVMARIARESAPARSADRAVRTPAASLGERLGAVWALAGVIFVVWVTVNGWIGVGPARAVTSFRIGSGRLVLMPVEGWASLFLCVGLVLYLVGLFAPLRRRHG